jgi:hypothetical protein
MFVVDPIISVMFDMAITRKWSRWNWTVSDHTGRVVAFGWEFSRSEAAYKAARALFQLLLTTDGVASKRQKP